jgi:6-phosphogluconate dehydrogenase
MLPAGEATSATIASLAEAGEPGDIIVDGGNSNWQVAQADAAKVKSHGLAYVDVGVSGGIWGLENGYCLMAGGEPQSYRTILPILESLAPPDGLVYCGAVGAGHFVKMVHNGIEYGLMQAYAEGFEIMKAADEFSLDLHEIASIWRYGSVVRSWLLELLDVDPRRCR